MSSTPSNNFVDTTASNIFGGLGDSPILFGGGWDGNNQVKKSSAKRKSLLERWFPNQGGKLYINKLLKFSCIILDEGLILKKTSLAYCIFYFLIFLFVLFFLSVWFWLGSNYYVFFFFFLLFYWWYLEVCCG